MNGTSASPSFALLVVSLSAPTPDTAKCEVSDPAPVAVMVDNVGTRLPLRTFNKLDCFATETFFNSWSNGGD